MLAALAGTAGAAEAPAYSLESARATPMPVLAESLLGKVRAADVVDAVPDTEPLVSGIGRIDFLHRARPLGEDFCVRQHDAIIFPAGFDLPAADPNQPEHALKRPMGSDAF